ncbi:NAD(P)/FAD-dependent oxidoreductase [Gordonia sp. LUNF6]|uniref:NAD(P)/FAD-dependent oxidoreductase n=1 Tax=unclassified Gordonia (in: high G+C Gram-positive bacteria) TaxID=2657482 RepID=UPI0007840A43|nr:NAD(P)/FAD-dependent oxidoreductase [Gordonia sp. QH-12]
MTNSREAGPNRQYDVLIAGGGPAGLGAAVTLGRSLRTVLVVDAGEQRNRPAEAAHNVLGREGTAPTDLLAAGRAEAAGYGAEIFEGTVLSAERISGGFTLSLSSGETVGACRVLLATGAVDELPAIEGLAAGWGRTVLHCPYCHGWEVRGRRIGVVATSPMAEHQALLFRQLSEHVTVFDHESVLGAQARERLTAMDVPVVDGRVDRVLTDGDRVRSVRVAGAAYEVDAVAVATRVHARGELFQTLGGRVSDHPFGTYIETDATGRTAVDGVWAAGNARDPMAMVGAAAASGVAAGAAINADLVDEAVRRAVGAEPRVEKCRVQE